MPLPSLRMFQVAVGEWKKTHRNELMRLTDPDGYRSKVEFVATGTQRADRLNEVWQIDASPADIMLTSGRASIYMAVDVYSRRAIVLVTPTPRASAVGLLVRKCLKRWGWPERIHTDNGSDFVARQTRQLFDSAGIQVELSPPYNPKSKGIVERTIGTFQRDLQVMPGFIGHSVADRKRIEGRKALHARLGASDVDLFDVQLDLVEFQAWADDWAENRYAHTAHEGLGGRTPFTMAASYAGPVRWLTDEAMLDVLLAPIASNGGLRKVTKQGVRIDGAQYLPMGAQPGTEVLVRMDPEDLGRAMLFTPSGDAFLGEAICPELAGLDPAEVLARAKAMQKAAEAGALAEIRGKKRELKALARLEVRGVGRSTAELVAFPQRGETHATPGLDAAAEAAGRRRAPEPRREDPDEEARQAAFVASFPRQKPKPRPETDEERYLRAHALRQRIAAGGEVSADERLWLDGYATTPECRTFDGMVAEFGFARMFPNHALQRG